MVGRALIGDVEGDFQAVAAGGFDERVEILKRAQLGVDGLVAAFRRADGPGTAGVAVAGFRDVVFSLAVGVADGMNRRQVEHVESHVGDVRKPGDHVSKGALSSGL